MAKFKVYVTDERHADYEIERSVLAKADAELILCNCVTEEDLIRECADADGLLLDLAPCTGKVIRALEHCKVINRYGVGYDNVDVSAATEKGIQVTFVPDYCMEDVSDHALALLMTCLRDTARKDRLVRQGQWNLQRTSFRLQNKVLGLLGFGRIARALARKCSGFGLKEIVVYDPYVSEEACAAAGVRKADLHEVLTQADFVSLHMPVTPETRGMINAETIALMKETAILVNTGRGPLIDDAALVAALREKRILTAGLDTHNAEPLPKDSPYFELDNVVLTDHAAYSTVEGVIDLKTKSAQNVADILLGKAPQYSVNKI